MWIDVDLENKIIRITPEKGGEPRIFQISEKLTATLESHNRIRKNQGHTLRSKASRPQKPQNNPALHSAYSIASMSRIRMQSSKNRQRSKTIDRGGIRIRNRHERR